MEDFKIWCTPKYNSMHTSFQGEPLCQWITKRKSHISLYLSIHRDYPEIQSENERISHNFSRSLFYGHGLLLSDYNDSTTMIIDDWFHSKIHPWENNEKNWKIDIQDVSLIQFNKSGDGIIEMDGRLSHLDIAKFLLLYVPILQSRILPLNHTPEPWLSVYVPNHSHSWYGGIEYDSQKKYYCIIDSGTTRGKGMVQPEQVTLKDVAYILCDNTGFIIAQQTATFSLNHPLSSFLFFLQFMSLLHFYKAEIVAYNGAFDATVLSRWPYNPCVKQMLSVWNYDVMYMTKNHLNIPKCCSLAHSYKSIFKKDFDKKFHVSINDCLATKELFIFLINQK